VNVTVKVTDVNRNIGVNAQGLIGFLHSIKILLTSLFCETVADPPTKNTRETMAESIKSPRCLSVLAIRHCGQD